MSMQSNLLYNFLKIKIIKNSHLVLVELDTVVIPSPCKKYVKHIHILKKKNVSYYIKYLWQIDCENHTEKLMKN